MPPPRLFRPLRPWHPAQSSRQVRWASGSPTDWLHAPHSDALSPSSPLHKTDGPRNQGSDKPVAIPGTSPSPPKQSQAQTARLGWRTRIIDTASPLHAKVPRSSSKEQTRSFHSSDTLTTTPARHEFEPTPEPPQAEQQTDVGHGATNVDRNVTSFPTSPHLHHAERKDNKARMCGQCQQYFFSSQSFKRHQLFTDHWVKEPNQTYSYFCEACMIPLPSLVAARRHVMNSPLCIMPLTRSKLPSTGSKLPSTRPKLPWTGSKLLPDAGQPGSSSLEALRQALQAADSRYQRSTFYLVSVAQTLDSMSSPQVKPIANHLTKYLHQLKSEMTLRKNGPSLFRIGRYFKSPKLVKANAETPQNKAGVLVKYMVSKNRTPVAPNLDEKPTAGVQVQHPTESAKNQLGAGKYEHPPASQHEVAGIANPSSDTTNAFRIRKDLNTGNTEAKRHVLPKTHLPVTGGSRVTGGKEDSTSTLLNGTGESSKGTIPRELIQTHDTVPESECDSQRPTRQAHTQANLIQSSEQLNIGAPRPLVTSPDLPELDSTQEHASSSTPAASRSKASEQSLLDELFPESSSYIQSNHSERDPYPKLELPSSNNGFRILRSPVDSIKSTREKYIKAFQAQSEQIFVLQLLHCSTELTDSDIRRIIPKGKHIESWAREGAFHKTIPGRDPLTLERLPFYYLLFKSPEAALAYQKNASRLHKLSQLYQPSSIFSTIPPPKGFLEDGEDIHLATSSYLLKPTGFPLHLNMVMQPYNPSLRELIEEGGYRPIVPAVSNSGKPIWKVLMHIEGYEPSPMDLYQLLSQDGYLRGIQWPFHKEQAGIRRLRDLVNLKVKMLPISSSNPRAAGLGRQAMREVPEDALSASYLASFESGEDSAESASVMVKNRVYNRWIIEFEDEQAARRFARLWNRKALPVSKSSIHVTWKDLEEVRMCNTEFLW